MACSSDHWAGKDFKLQLKRAGYHTQAHFKQVGSCNISHGCSNILMSLQSSKV